MRGTYDREEMTFSLISPEQRVPKDHPLQYIKRLADRELSRFSGVQVVQKSDLRKFAI